VDKANSAPSKGRTRETRKTNYDFTDILHFAFLISQLKSMVFGFLLLKRNAKNGTRYRFFATPIEVRKTN